MIAVFLISRLGFVFETGILDLEFLSEFHFFWQVSHPLAVKLNDLPRARPDTLFAIRAALLDDLDFRFHQFDGILGTYAHAATAVVAFAGNDVNHEGLIGRHEVMRRVSGLRFKVQGLKGSPM